MPFCWVTKGWHGRSRCAMGRTGGREPAGYPRLEFRYPDYCEVGTSPARHCRMEGVAVRDALGSCKGFRWPRYVISIEPGPAFSYKNNLLNINAPWAVERSCKISSSKIININHRHGDAALPITPSSFRSQEGSCHLQKFPLELRGAPSQLSYGQV